MFLRSIQVKNFRLLASAKLDLATDTTLIVGRNNSGKTSLAEVVRRLVEQDKVRFLLEDFSSSSYDRFIEALARHHAGTSDADVRDALPSIEVRLTFSYEPDDPALGALGEFIVDLDPDCTEALIILQYRLKDGAIERLFDQAPIGDLTAELRTGFFKLMRERIPAYYESRVWAQDPNDDENKKEVERTHLRTLLKTGFINAQRGLDDITSRESDVLSKVLEDLFTTASKDGARDEDKAVVAALKEAVDGIQSEIEDKFSVKLKGLLPTLETFGYPGLGGPELATETTLDVQKLLSSSTKVRYEGQDGIMMPEAYNGLGVRNLIYVLLKIVSFYRAFTAAQKRPGVHVIFIEEPEAHLHPQMQEVFIKQLGKIAKALSEADSIGDGQTELWPVQFIVSTHSSHVANAAQFETVRYFLPTATGNAANVRQTIIKDLSVGLRDAPPEQTNFLHQYLTLTRCDLFFADKVILVEGTTERILLPVIIRMLEDQSPDLKRLSSQYITIMEVGGAYAHRFFDLLKFLELPALIITDLDSVEKPGGKACVVNSAKASSNACLNKWFEKGAEDGALTPLDMVGKADTEKVKDIRCIAFQVPEALGGPCGRSFEDAFMLANRNRFGIEGADSPALEEGALKEAKKVKKSAFALMYAIDEQDWQIPKYIVNGLSWLANQGSNAQIAGVTPAESPADNTVSNDVPPGEGASA